MTATGMEERGRDTANVHPDLRRALTRMPAMRADTRWGRALARSALSLLPSTKVEGVTLTRVHAGTARVRVYRPDEVRSDASLLWVHGGGLLIGAGKMDDRFCGETARALGIVVVSAEYRLAPEHPFPAAHDDVHAAWRWLRAHADRLGLNPDRIVIGGQSAGAGLAAAIVQRLHDEGTTPLAQLLLCPMLDDRTAWRHDIGAREHWVWDNRSNSAGWDGYLGVRAPSTDLPQYAVPARRADLTGLPATWISVGDIELFYTEDLDYAERLRAAEVPVTFDVTPGGPHGFEAWAPTAPVSISLLSRLRMWLGKQIGVHRV